MKVVAGCLGLSAFALAILSGLAAHAEVSEILLRAVVSMFVCALVGFVAGAVGKRAMDDAAAEYRAAHPLEEPQPERDAATEDDAQRDTSIGIAA